MKTTNLTQNNKLPDGFGDFPYIVVQMFSGGYCIYRLQFVYPGAKFEKQQQFLPIYLPEGFANFTLAELLSHEKVFETLKKITSDIAEHHQLRCCLVVAKDRAYYYENGVFKESNRPPSGGMLIIGSEFIDREDQEHYRMGN